MSYPVSIYCHNFSPSGNLIEIKQLSVQAPIGTTIKFITADDNINIVIGKSEIYEIQNISLVRAIVGNSDGEKALFTYEKKEG